MSRNQDKNKEEKQIEYVEYNSMNEDEINYQNQYLKATEIIGQNNPELEECGIKINLEKIEERAPEEEESCICSIPATKERIKQSIRTEKQILKLKKLLKYKNILYYYFNKWKKKLSNSSVKKRIKKIKRKKKVKNIKYNIGDSFIAREMSNDTINENKNIENNIKKEKNTIEIQLENNNIQENENIENKKEEQIIKEPQKENEKKEEEKKEQELLKQIEEEKKKKSDEEYDQWKDLIKVGEEGEEGMDFTKEEVINKFLDYIKIRKVVSLEDISGTFKLNPNDIVMKLNQYEKEGRILIVILMDEDQIISERLYIILPYDQYRNMIIYRAVLKYREGILRQLILCIYYYHHVIGIVSLLGMADHISVGIIDSKPYAPVNNRKQRCVRLTCSHD